MHCEFLTPDGAVAHECKTKRVDDAREPSWEETIMTPPLELATVQLRMTVWDWDPVGSNDFMGCVELGGLGEAGPFGR